MLVVWLLIVPLVVLVIVGTLTIAFILRVEKVMLLLLHTTEHLVWRNTNISYSTILSGTTLGSSSATWTTTSGIDQVGNAGQIPSSGAIQMNHFRGTNGSATSSNLVSYGFQVYQSSGNPSGPWSTTVQIWIAGHYGTNGSGSNWSNVPFRWIDSPAKGGVAATRWYGSDSHSSNGNNTGKSNIAHDTFPNIGACTRYIYNTNIMHQS